MQSQILIIDDDKTFLQYQKRNLHAREFAVDAISEPLDVIVQIQQKRYDCVLLDVKMPDISGPELLMQILKLYPTMPVIMISGEGTIPIAVDALKHGAYDFFEKGLLDQEKLIVTINNAIQKHNILEELRSHYEMIGESNELKSVFQQIDKVVDTDVRVIVGGETGTGKELVARAIHYNGARKAGRYIKVNCAALPETLLESELFGHVKGAFSGAIENRPGKFLAANGGTIFLDEIGEFPFNLQAKLLRVLDSGEVAHLGSDKEPKKIDVRVISATNKNLEKMVSEKTFREDLYYRLLGVKIVIPPLRERRKDILPLADHFRKRFSEKYNRQVLRISRQAEAILENYPWPGNVRELCSAIENIVIFAKSNEISIKDVLDALENKGLLPEPVMADAYNTTIPLKDAKINFEREYIFHMLNKFKWKINETAKALGVDRINLYKKMRKLGIKENRITYE